jgi:putative oxidoreductase
MSALKKAIALGLKVAAALSFLAPLATRVTVGYTFLLTGRGKLADLDRFAGYLEELHVPFAHAQAPFLAGLEFVGGACLVLGLLSRLMGLGLFGTMVGALVSTDLSAFVTSWAPTGDKGPLDFDQWVMMLLLSWVILYGPGPVSLDRWLSKFVKSDGAS